MVDSARNERTDGRVAIFICACLPARLPPPRHAEQFVTICRPFSGPITQNSENIFLMGRTVKCGMIFFCSKMSVGEYQEAL